MVELGWPGCSCPKRSGGLGLGLVDMVVVHGGDGAGAVPRSVLLVGRVRHARGRGDSVSTIGSRRWRPGRPAARSRSTKRATATRSTASARARSRKSGRWRLTGQKPIVLDGHTADWVLVVARTEQGIGTFLVEAPAGRAVPAWDVTRKVARLELRRYARPSRSVPTATRRELWQRVVDDANVALCAELVGSMEAALRRWPSSTRRCGCSSTARSPRSRRSSTRRPTCCTASSWRGSVRTTRPGRRTPTSRVRAEAAAMAKAYVAEAAN